MRAVVQRCRQASVQVEEKVLSSIDSGVVLLLGIKKGDGIEDADYLMEKIINLRIFEDEAGKMNRSLLDVMGKVLLISQFTLYGDCRKGRRPGFDRAELPEPANRLYEYAAQYLRERGLKVGMGQFGANMQVSLINDGPCTILLDSEKII